MSPLRKHLVITGFIAIPMIAIAFSIIHREFLSTFLTHTIEHNNSIVSRAIVTALVPTLTELLNNEIPARQKKGLRNQLHQSISRIIQGLPILRVNLYALDGNLIYSSTRELIGAHREDNPRFAQAKRGKTVSHFRRPLETDHVDAPQSDAGFVESYIPLRLGPRESIQGVFELYTDISPWLTKFNQFELQLTLAVTVLLLISYLLFLFGIKKIEKKIAQQNKTIHSRTHALEDLSSRFITSQEMERKRLARELHDSLGQLLSALKIRFENAIYMSPRETASVVHEQFEPLVPLIQASIDECRRVSMAIRPSMLDDLGLLPTLSWFLREFRESCPHIKIQTRIDIDEEHIPERLKTTIYRITQEAMHNIAKHSDASLVGFSLRKNQNKVDLFISDNGKGFEREIDPRTSDKGGFGLDSMKERAELSGGIFTMQTTPGQGTNITATWLIE